MWSLYNTSKQWSKRPSEMVGITEEYTAFCFDEAVGLWGSYVVNELEKIEGKNEKEVTRKRHQRLLKLLDAPDSVRFRSLRNKKKGGES